MWIRKCSCCGIELKYKYKRSADFQEIKNSSCRKCSNHKEFDDVYKNSNGLWCRKCPKCKKELSYKRRQICLVRYHKNSLCKSCFQIGEKAFWYGKTHSIDTNQKISKANKGRKVSKETKQKLSEQKIGKNNPRYGKKATEEHREKMRLAALNRIKKQGIMVSFNLNACKFINELNKKFGWNLQHAKNGGEIEISGYCVDGYDKDKNIVFEYDERHHNGPKRKQKDINRQQIIMEKIKPSMFIRYDEKNDRLYDTLTNKDFLFTD